MNYFNSALAYAALFFSGRELLICKISYLSWKDMGKAVTLLLGKIQNSFEASFVLLPVVISLYI